MERKPINGIPKSGSPVCTPGSRPSILTGRFKHGSFQRPLGVPESQEKVLDAADYFDPAAVWSADRYDQRFSHRPVYLHFILDADYV
jgi:hypothetical protein